VAGQTYGPVDTDARGRALVPVIVPPGTADATVTTVAATGQTVADLPLKVAPPRRAWVLVTPASIPADPGRVVPLRALVVTPIGRLADDAVVTARITHGTLDQAVHEGGGIYRFDYHPPPLGPNLEALLEVFVDDAEMKGPPADTRTLELVGTRPDEVTLEVAAATKKPGQRQAPPANQVTAIAQVRAAGTGLDGRTLRFVGMNARRVGEVRDAGAGRYEADFETTGADVVVDVTARPMAGRNAVRDILLVPTRTRTTNDALDAVPIFVLALDEYGYPVKGAEIALDVLAGGGRLPSDHVVTDETGMAEITYTPGTAPAIARIRGRTDKDASTIAILQVPADALPGWTGLPESGNGEDRALTSTWSGLSASAQQSP
jgi:hypothetical protein